MRGEKSSHTLRAVSVQDHMALIHIKKSPCEACDSVIRAAGARLLLGFPGSGWLSVALPEASAMEIADACGGTVRCGVRIADVYGMEMHRESAEILRALSEAGAEILCVSLCTSRMSIVYSGENVNASAVLYDCFTFIL